MIVSWVGRSGAVAAALGWCTGGGRAGQSLVRGEQFAVEDLGQRDTGRVVG